MRIPEKGQSAVDSQVPDRGDGKQVSSQVDEMSLGKWLLETPSRLSLGANTPPPAKVDGSEMSSWKLAKRKVAVGVLCMVLSTVLGALLWIFGQRLVEKWIGPDTETMRLVRTAMVIFYAAAAGVVSRWLAVASVAIPGVSFCLTEYLGRWLADTVSVGLVVTAVMVALSSLYVSTGTIEVAFGEAGWEIFIAVAFALGYFSNRAREMLYRIAEFNFLQQRYKPDGHENEEARDDQARTGDAN